MKKNRVDGFIFDLDGTIYLGDRALPGAVETIAGLRQRGKQVLFVSNKPLESRQAYAEKLSCLGIPAEAKDVITSAYVLGRYLRLRQPHLNYYVIGEEELREELRSHGLKLVEDRWDLDPKDVVDAEGIDAVIVAFDRTLDYRKLNTAYQALMRGAHFYATNTDKACPMPEGAIPDAGLTVAGLEHITGRKLELVAGKPSGLILEMALECLGLQADRCLMTGDRLETDIRMGREAGMLTAVVLTGVTRAEDLNDSQVLPDLVLHRLDELLDQTV